MKKRAGRVMISNRVILDTDTNVLADMLKDLVIVRAEQMFIADAIEYQALCDKFDEVDLTEKLPLYRVIVNSETREVSYERVNN